MGKTVNRTITTFKHQAKVYNVRTNREEIKELNTTSPNLSSSLETLREAGILVIDSTLVGKERALYTMPKDLFITLAAKRILEEGEEIEYEDDIEE